MRGGEQQATQFRTIPRHQRCTSIQRQDGGVSWLEQRRTCGRKIRVRACVGDSVRLHAWTCVCDARDTGTTPPIDTHAMATGTLLGGPPWAVRVCELRPVLQQRECVCHAYALGEVHLQRDGGTSIMGRGVTALGEWASSRCTALRRCREGKGPRALRCGQGGFSAL
jgi:hypothetical protein